MVFEDNGVQGVTDLLRTGLDRPVYISGPEPGNTAPIVRFVSAQVWGPNAGNLCQEEPTMTDTSESLTMSVTDAAKLLGISRAMAYECARTGELPTVRLGGRILVPRHRLLALLDGHAEPPHRSQRAA